MNSIDQEEQLQDLPPEGWQTAPVVAERLQDLPPEETIPAFRSLGIDQATEVFPYLNASMQATLLESLDDGEKRRILADLRPDDRTRLFEELAPTAVEELLRLLPRKDYQEAKALLAYPEESVGRLMTPDYVAVSETRTVAQALEDIRSTGGCCETIDVVYVTDAVHKLVGGIELQRFVLASADTSVSDIVDRAIVALSPERDREEAVKVMQKFDRFSLPVVDTAHRLVGIVTADDILDVAEEEATEDIQKAAAVEPLRLRYQEAGVWALYRKRLPWLLGLVAVNLVASGIIAAYETTLSSVIALAFFIPLLMGSGGNTGSQSATLIVRALATDDTERVRWKRTLVKEILLGAALGASMAVAAYVAGWVKGGFEIGAVVSLSMLSIVVMSNLIGVVFPLVLTRLGVDPALAGGPLITSVSDITSLLIYFFVATRVLRELQIA